MPKVRNRVLLAFSGSVAVLTVPAALVACAIPTLPGYAGSNEGLGMIGASSWIGQNRIYMIQTINGQDIPPPGGAGIKVPPGEYRIQYKWGYWNRPHHAYENTAVKVEAGKCYQPWFVERRLPAERYSEGTMLCWDRFTANGDGTYSPKKVCEPLTSIRYPVETTLAMNEYPKGHELCKGFD